MCDSDIKNFCSFVLKAHKQLDSAIIMSFFIMKAKIMTKIKDNFELVTINEITLNVDLTLLDSEELYFNATEIAKQYDKQPIHWLRNQEAKDYIEVIISTEKSQYENLIKITQGGKNQGTWLHKSLAIPFARWCDAKFAYYLDKWIIRKLENEKYRKIERQLSRLEFPAMMLAERRSQRTATLSL